MAISYGLGAIGLTLALMSLYWQYIGIPGLAQPGQWLLLSYVIDYARFIIVMVPFAFMRAGVSKNYGDFFNLGGVWIYYVIGVVLQFALPMILFIWCAWKVADSIPWRVIFLLRAIAPLISIPVMVVVFRVWFSSNPRSMSAVPALAVGGVLLPFEIWALLGEALSGRCRYWTHWAGLGLSMFGHTLTFAWGVYYLLMLP